MCRYLTNGLVRSEDEEDYDTLIFTLSNNAYSTTFDSAMPSTGGDTLLVVLDDSGAEISQMRFTEVLYVHKVCLHHIYISELDEMGLEAALSGGGRITQGPDSQGVGKVP